MTNQEITRQRVNLINPGFFYIRGLEGGVFMTSENPYTRIKDVAFLKNPAAPPFRMEGVLILGSVAALNRQKPDGQ